ncbi:MAG TPA: hypothetical protein VKU94_03505 [Geobacterales bacterium]|nr:hypothetical protein [Geobacterales bacterium]
MSDEQLKKLVELKKELESKKANLEKELELLNINLSIINAAIAERSFVTADTLLKPHEEKQEIKIEEKPKPNLVRSEKILDIDGYVLASMNIFDDNHIEITPNNELKFKEDISPFKNFLIKKVFEGKKSSDIEEGRPAEKAFSYEIKKDEEGNIIEISLKNIDINDDQEMRNLNGSIKWTLKRIREKLKGV